MTNAFSKPLTRTLEDYKMLYASVDDWYDKLTGARKEWVDDNWESMLDHFLEYAEQSLEESVETDDECCDCRECEDHKDDPQSNQCEGCECVLHEWVAIHCLKNAVGEEAVLCSACWQNTDTREWREEDDECDFHRFCTECHEGFKPSVEHKYDSVCDGCVSEQGKSQHLWTHEEYLSEIKEYATQ